MGGAMADDDPLPRPRPTKRARSQFRKPAMEVFKTTLWEYPSQHYGETIQGNRNYIGATPSWVIWQLLRRYTQEGDLVVDPMCGGGTTIDVSRDLKRRVLGYDIAPSREDIFRSDARRLPIEGGKVDFVFMDPPYSTHIRYSDEPGCIGKLDAAAAGRGENAYFAAMRHVIGEMHRVLRPGGVLGLYVSDSIGARNGEPVFIPIGARLFSMLEERFEPIDVVCVVRRNAKIAKGNFRREAEESGVMMRGFNHLFIMRKPSSRG